MQKIGDFRISKSCDLCPPPHTLVGDRVNIFSQVLSLRFNVNCDAATGFYGLAEGAFGGDGGESSSGTCPARDPLSPEECDGSVSTCWSPGVRDTDCPFNGLCCVSQQKIK